MRKLGVWMTLLVVSVVVSGCGGDDAPASSVAASDGERIGAALKSADVTEVECMGSDEYGPGQEMPAGFVPENAGSSRAVIEASNSRQSRSTELWMAKAPAYVKIGSDPVEVAVLDDEGEPRTRLQYSEGGNPNDENTSTRVRFLPCGDKQPTWRGYAGAIISDAEPGCLRFAEQVAGESSNVSSVSLNGKCT